MDPAELYRRVFFGQIEGVSEAIMTLGQSQDPKSIAWAGALTAALSSAVPEQVGLPQIAQVRACAPDERAAQVALRTCALGARRALIDFDHQSAAGWIEVGESLRAKDTEPAFELERHLAELERGLEPNLDAEGLRARARTEGNAAVVVDLTVAEAWQAELFGDVETALSAARRASRMARTESMPQQEYFANMILARCRRLIGHPHLANRILNALVRFASVQWHGWLSWELLLAGCGDVARDLALRLPENHTARIATLSAWNLLASARDGSSSRFSEAATSLRSVSLTSMRLSADVQSLLGALDARVSIDAAPQDLRAWLSGDVPKPPRGLHGMAADADGSDSLKSAVVFVSADPPAKARRVLAPGTELLAGKYLRMEQSQRRQGRVDTALAVLALAGPDGLSTQDLFTRVYEFDFDPEIHTGALRKLVARVDDWLGDAGEIIVGEGRRSLCLQKPILVADPRSVPPVDVRVLAVLASKGSTSAKEAAKRLRIPLRTAQAALQDLLADGTCQRVRSGNVVEYQIEDTTFSEPTIH